MPNDYFNHSANVIAAGIRALAAQVNNIATEISTGLDKLPDEVELKRGLTRFAVDTGAADAYVVDLPYVPALVDGLEVSFRPINSNTGASTVNVNSLGAKAIVLYDLSTLGVASIVANSMVTLRYSSPGDHYILLTGAASVQSVNDANTLDGIDSAGFLQVDTINLVNPAGNYIHVLNQSAGNAMLLSAYGANGGGAISVLDHPDNTGVGVSISKDGVGAALVVTSNATRTVPMASFTSLSSTATGDVVSVVQDHASSSGDALSIQQDGSGDALNVNHDGSNGYGLYVEGNNSARTFNLAVVRQAHASSTARAMLVTQIGTGDGLTISEGSGATGTSLDIQLNSSGKGIAVTDLGSTVGGIMADISSNNSSRTADLVSIHQDHASSSAKGLVIKQDGTGYALEINHTPANATNTSLYVAHNFGGQAAYFVDFTTGVSSTLDLVHVHNNNQNRTHPMLGIHNDHASSVATGLDIIMDGPAATAARFYSDVATRTQPLVEIINDNSTGSGVALLVNQDQGGRAIDVDMSGAGTAVSIDHTGSSGANLVINKNVSGNANAMVLIDQQHASNAGPCLDVRNDGSGDAVIVDTTRTNSTAMRITSNTASRTVPVVEIVNDNATGSGVALQIQSDQGKALDITNGGISENAEQYTVTAGTKSLDLDRGTAFYPSGAMTAVAVDFTFDNPAASGQHCAFILELSNMAANTDGTPWPTSVDWAGGTEPVWTSGIDIVSFWTRDGGTPWHGAAVSLDSQ